MFAPNKILIAAAENEDDLKIPFVFCRAKRIRINAAQEQMKILLQRLVNHGHSSLRYFRWG